MNEDRIRELAARREGPALDFKREQYEWSNDGNIELAKDIMAIANGLPRGAAPGHILIGVDEQADGTGLIVGVAAAVHLDDAAMHEKLKMLLNRVPSFAYAAVEVDGRSVGVFEIRAGGRPFFSLRDVGGRHKLRRFEARVRVGTATDSASPDQIQAWSREDDDALHDLRRIEIEEREARLVVRPFVETLSITFTDDPDTYEERLVLDLLVHNRGESRFTIDSVRQTWTLTERFYAHWPGRAVRASVPHSIITSDVGGSDVAAGQNRRLTVPIEQRALLEYVEREAGIACSSTDWPLWIAGEVTVETVGVTGRRSSSTQRITTSSIETAYEAGRVMADGVRQEQRRLAAEAEAERRAKREEIPLVEAVIAPEPIARATAAALARLPPHRRRGR